MWLEWSIIIASWIAAIIALIFVVRADQIREAVFIFLVMQFVTWSAGLFVAENEWVSYPVRCFPEVTETSFTFEFFVYPAISVIFCLTYPERASFLRRLLHYAAFVLGITVLEVMMERYTDLIEYHGWTWYWTALTLLSTIFITRTFYLWYRKGMRRYAH